MNLFTTINECQDWLTEQGYSEHFGGGVNAVWIHPGRNSAKIIVRFEGAFSESMPQFERDQDQWAVVNQGDFS